MREPGIPPCITRDPNIKAGAWVIRGTRIEVRAVQGRNWRGESIDDLLRDFPHVPRPWMEAALAVRLPAET